MTIYTVYITYLNFLKYFDKVIYNTTNNIFIFPIYNIYEFFISDCNFLCVL